MNKKLTFLTILSFFLFQISFQISYAQKVNIDHLKGLKVRNIGPAGMSGRVTSIDVNLQNEDEIIAGTASGGVWKSTSGGVTWQPIFDDAPVQSVGAVAINQKNPDEIWVGTGEGNPRNSQNSGEGLYKSLDGGKNWTLMGLKNTKTIHRILIHRDNPNIVFVAATGSAWGPNKERGVYKTTDGGKTWTHILYKGNEVGCADLVIDPVNPNKLIAAMWEYGRKPWTFNSGGKESGLYISYDGGDSWERRTDKDGLPKGDLGRMGLAIAPSNTDIIYALVEAKENALYKSTDGGFKWKKHSTDENIGNRPFYYSDIFVDPINENRVYSSWSIMSKSEDGGKSWDSFVGWEVHPDHHAFWVHPTNPNFIIEGNDGGLNITRDRGKTWRFAENLPLAQFYHIDYDMAIPYRVCGGMQDNGSWIGPSQVWQSGGIRNHHWQEIYFGDGFDVSIRPDDGRYAYAMSQGGNLGYVDTHSGRTTFIKPVHPEGKPLRFNWNAAFAQSSQNDCGIYYGSQYLHKSLDCGKSWEIISPDLTTNDTTKQKQGISGGLTIDATNAENYTTIVAIAPSPLDENTIWVGTDDGNLQLTRNGGKNWSNLASKLSGAPAGCWIPQIVASSKNAGEALIVVNDYRRNNWKPMLYHTKDFGESFKRIANEKQVNGFVWSVTQDPEVENLIWLGTDFGLYFSIDAGQNWNKWTNGFPSVSTSDLKIHPREHDLIIGTFGRAAWILDDIRPIREIAKTSGKVLEKPFATFPAPDAYLAFRKSVDGTRFTADAYYEGQNRRSGAMITVWVKPEKKETKKEVEKPKKSKAKDQVSEKPSDKDSDKKKGKGKKDEKVKITILDSMGDTIRNFSAKIDTGMTRIYWNLRANGVAFPSRRPSKPDADPPQGNQVLPGTYKVMMHYGEQKDSTSVTVHADPRVEQSMANLKAKQRAYDNFSKVVEKAKDGFDRLQDGKKAMKKVDSALSNVPDSLKTEIKDLAKAIQDSIKVLENEFMDPAKQKGIQRNPKTLNRALWTTRTYLNASEGEPSQSAKIMVKTTREKTQAILDRINSLFENEFKEYREKVEAVQYSLFKDFDEIKIE